MVASLLRTAIMRFLLVLSLTFILCLAPEICLLSRGISSVYARAADDGIAFSHVFRQLAEKYHAPIIVEGTPLRTHLTEDDFLDLWIRYDSATKAIPVAAALFDYRVERRGDSYLLLKQFSSPFDMPDVSMAEMETATREVIAILDSISPPVDKSLLKQNYLPSSASYHARQLIKSITEEQWGIFRASPQGAIPLADLQAEQRTLLQQIALYQDFGQYRDKAESVLDWWERMRDVSLAREKPDPKSPVGFRFHRVETNGQEIVHFSSLEKAMATRNSRSDADPAGSYLRASDALKSLRQTPASETITYAELAEKLNGKSGNQNPFSVDEIVAGKRVTLFGTAALPDVELFRAAAAVHGLRVHQPRARFYSLSRPRPQTPVRIEGALISEAIRATVPDELARALRFRETARMRGERPLPRLPELNPDYYEYEAARIYQRSEQLAFAAITILRVFADRELLTQADSPPIPARELPYPGERLLILWGFNNNGYLNSLVYQRPDRPLLVERMERGSVRCVQGPGGAGVSLVYTNDDGTLGTMFSLGWNHRR